MKKILVLLVCVAVLFTVFTACKGDDKKDDGSTAKYSSTKIETDEAKIANGDAINLIKSYSKDELGLSEKEMKECSFLVANEGTEYKNNNYVVVIATIKTEHEDKNEEGEDITTYTFDNKGEYYIRFDGKQILARNGDSEFRELKVKAVPTTTQPSTEKATTTKAKKETTTKKKK